MLKLPAFSQTLLSPALTLATTESSRGRDWKGVVVDWHDWKSGGYVSSPELDHDVIAMRTSGTARLTQVRDGNSHTATVMRGNVSLHPRGIESRWSWDQPGAIAIVRVSDTLLADAAAATLSSPPYDLELENCFGRKDPFIAHIIALFLAELRAPPHPTQVYIADALSSALACHLVSRFNGHGVYAAELPTAIHARALQRVKDYIHENLHLHISLDTLATLANVSRFHFTRMFRENVGVSAMTYLERARMTRAQELLRSGELPLVQVALLVGYDDQSYFTRRFRLHFGLTPAAYIRQFRSLR